MRFRQIKARQADDVERRAVHWLGQRDGMAWWRWLLFAGMARYETAEEVYLRIPKARLTRCDAPVTFPVADNHCRDGGGQVRQQVPIRKPAKQPRRSIFGRIAAWLGRAA